MMKWVFLLSLLVVGVTMRPLRTMKNVAPLPSATLPCRFSRIG